jgi:rRNA maturation RNase YbeY
MAKVNFYKEQTRFSLKERAKLRKFIEHLFIKEGKNLGEINYILCSDEYLLHINRQYLGHDYYTDIITFDLSDNNALIIGEVYVSTDRVSENAVHLGVAVDDEIKRVLFHGALHLCGYKDKTKTQQRIMRIKENEYLSSYYQ